MTQIQVVPQDLQAKAEQIRAYAQKIQAAVNEVDTDINSLNTSVFEGHRADGLRQRYTQYRDYLTAFKPMAERFASELDLAAQKFIAADR